MHAAEIGEERASRLAPDRIDLPSPKEVRAGVRNTRELDDGGRDVHHAAERIRDLSADVLRPYGILDDQRDPDANLGREHLIEYRRLGAAG